MTSKKAEKMNKMWPYGNTLEEVTRKINEIIDHLNEDESELANA
jgi:hypothetical protein